MTNTQTGTAMWGRSDCQTFSEKPDAPLTEIEHIQLFLKTCYSMVMFISFEGGEGSGKTTQIARLADALGDHGYDVITTREPGGVPEAEAIRNLLVQRDGGDWDAMAEVLLFSAARVMHVKNLIKPALADGKIVICDRFTDSTIAYQGYGRGLDIDKIKHIEKIAIADFAPDLTFILDIDIETGLARSKSRLSETDNTATEDRFERLDTGFHEKLRAGFLDIARQNPQRCHVIDAAQEIEVIAAEVQRIVLERMEN